MNINSLILHLIAIAFWTWMGFQLWRERTKTACLEQLLTSIVKDSLNPNHIQPNDRDQIKSYEGLKILLKESFKINFDIALPPTQTFKKLHFLWVTTQDIKENSILNTKKLRNAFREVRLQGYKKCELRWVETENAGWKIVSISKTT